MQELNREGRARAIGVSNFHPDRLVDLIEHNEIVPAVNQIETHPFHQRADDQELMRERGVQIESWGPFAEGKNDLFTNPILSRDRRGARQVGRPGRAALAHPARRRRHPQVRPTRADGPEPRRLRLRAHRRRRWPASRPSTPARALFFDHRDPAMVSWLGRPRASTDRASPTSASPPFGGRDVRSRDVRCARERVAALPPQARPGRPHRDGGRLECRRNGWSQRRRRPARGDGGVRGRCDRGGHPRPALP